MVAFKGEISNSDSLRYKSLCYGAHGNKAHLKGRPGKESLKEDNTKLGNAGCDGTRVSFWIELFCKH